jgi:Predicted flavin-nucleotide-binding protein
MRRNDREVKDINNIIEIMQRCDVCRIAINDYPVPYILPLNFGMELLEDKIILYFHGANEGRKYELIRNNNQVSFEMDCSHNLVITPETGSCTMEYESVLGYGFIEFVNEDSKEHALNSIMKQYHKEDFSYNKNVIARTTVMKLEVENMTCKVRMKRKDI